MTTLKIDRLEIRSKGISPQGARTLAGGLGNELLKRLAQQQPLLRKKRTINIGKIDSGTLQTSRNSSSSDLRGMIAGKIVESIASKTK